MEKRKKVEEVEEKESSKSKKFKLFHGTPLLEAAKTNDVVACKQILSTVDIPQQAIELALASAIHNGSHDVINCFLSTGHKINSQFLNDSLLRFCKVGKLSVVETLLKYGADVNFLVGNETPLSVVCSYPSSEERINVVEFLINNGANVNVIYGKKPLVEACRQRSIEIVELLLSKGANVNSSYGGYTPLHVACDRKERHTFRNSELNIQLIEVLVKYGADLNIHTEKGSPVNMSFRDNNTELVEFLLTIGAKIHPSSLNTLITTSAGTYTALQKASLDGNLQKVQLFLNHKADVNFGAPGAPLQLGIRSGNPQVVKALVAAGAVLGDAYIEIGHDSGQQRTLTPHQLCFCQNKDALPYLMISHSPTTHKQFDAPTRKSIVSFMLANKRQGWGLDNSLLHKIFSYSTAAYAYQKVNEERKILLTMEASALRLRVDDTERKYNLLPNAVIKARFLVKVNEVTGLYNQKLKELEELEAAVQLQ